MDFKDQIKHFKDYKLDNKLTDFFKSMTSGNLKKKIIEDLEPVINETIQNVDEILPDGIENSSIGDINDALDEIGLEPISSDIFESIINYDQGLFDREDLEYPEGFEW